MHQAIPRSHVSIDHRYNSLPFSIQNSNSYPCTIDVVGIAPVRESGSIVAPQSVQHPATRLQHSISKRKICIDGTIPYGKQALFSHTGEPQSLGEALSDTNWKNAINDVFLCYNTIKHGDWYHQLKGEI
jgi:hypothetical protein